MITQRSYPTDLHPSPWDGNGIPRIINRYKHCIGLGLEHSTNIKKGPAQPEWPKQDRKILRQCMSRSPYKPQTPSEDKGRRAMESFHGPQTHVPEGACAIKVSMKCSDAKANDYIPCNCARTSSSRVKID